MENDKAKQYSHEELKDLIKSEGEKGNAFIREIYDRTGISGVFILAQQDPDDDRKVMSAACVSGITGTILHGIENLKRKIIASESEHGFDDFLESLGAFAQELRERRKATQGTEEGEQP